MVIMSKNLYINEAQRQLQNPKYYKPLDYPLHPETATTLDRQLSNLAALGYITNKQYNFLRPDFNKMTSRYFYLLPKIHKPITSWPNPHMPAGRPIVSDCGSESSKICEFIDHFLQPVSNKHESFIKDTYKFISKIRDQTIDPSWLLISADVESLYTNMQIDRILESIREVFQEFPDLSRANEAILSLMETTLKNNDFEFNGQFCLQVCGIAMGRKYSPTAANIYLREFDHKAMREFEIKPHLYSRFLDDIFAVWPNTRQQLTAYQDYLNSLIPGIKVTFEIREQIISFLDTQVYKTFNEEGKCVLKTKVFFKPTDTHQLLHRSSFHPKHIFLGITKSPFIRFKRISSSFYDYSHSSNTLIKVLAQRGYNRRGLQRLKMQIWNNYSAIPKRDNPEALLDALNAPEIIPILTPFDNFHSILNRKWCRETRNNPVLKEARIIAAYKRHKNLGDLLVRGRLKKPEANPPAEKPVGSPNPPDTQDSTSDDSQTEALLDALVAAIERHAAPPKRSAAQPRRVLPFTRSLYILTLALPLRRTNITHTDMTWSSFVQLFTVLIMYCICCLSIEHYTLAYSVQICIVWYGLTPIFIYRKITFQPHISSPPIISKVTPCTDLVVLQLSHGVYSKVPEINSNKTYFFILPIHTLPLLLKPYLTLIPNP